MSTAHDVTTLEGLLALYGEPNPNSLAKEAPCLTAAYRDWLARTSFFAMATAGAGGLDCTPRGDAPGQAFRILDDRTLAIPDRRGNNRLDSLRNIVSDPRIALLFLIAGVNETLRINGRARITGDPALLESFSVEGKLPASVILVEIQSVYYQCARALSRARLWDPAAHVGRQEVPTAGQMSKSARRDPDAFDAEAYDASLSKRMQDSLY